MSSTQVSVNGCRKNNKRIRNFYAISIVGKKRIIFVKFVVADENLQYYEKNNPLIRTTSHASVLDNMQ